MMSQSRITSIRLRLSLCNRLRKEARSVVKHYMRLAPCRKGFTGAMLALACLLLPLSSILAANKPINNGLICVGKTVNPPVIDGKLDDACWQSAIEITPFLPGKQYAMAKEQTKVY